MKHLRKVTIQSQQSLRALPKAEPRAADFKTDYLNALYRDTSDYIYAKKNTLSA